MKLKQLTAKLLAFILLLSVSYSNTEGRFGTSRRNEDSIISRGYENRMQPPSVAPENQPSMKKPKDLSNPELWLNGTDNISQADTTEEDGIDFGDHTSEHLITKAWEHLDAGEYEEAQIYIDKLLEEYEETAHQQQEALDDFVPEGVNGNSWALNDVATAYLIQGQIALNEGNNEEALEHYQTIIDNFGFAQCAYKDDDGNQQWFEVAQAAEDKILFITEDIDFDDYSSEHLIKKAWEHLDANEYEDAQIYIDRLLEEYEETAHQQQEALDDFVPEGVNENSWALNDVATAYLIQGQIAHDQGNDEEA
ncbi:MAG: tetratricopeptide repeat protein, partial [Elusimicrobiota bacterium]